MYYNSLSIDTEVLIVPYFKLKNNNFLFMIYILFYLYVYHTIICPIP